MYIYIHLSILFFIQGKKWQEKLEQSRFAGGLENGKSNTRKHVSIRGGVTIRYAGRDQSAAPATGFKKQHKYEESMLISEALMQGKLLEAKEMVNGTPLF